MGWNFFITKVSFYNDKVIEDVFRYVYFDRDECGCRHFKKEKEVGDYVIYASTELTRLIVGRKELDFEKGILIHLNLIDQEKAINLLENDAELLEAIVDFPYYKFWKREDWYPSPKPSTAYFGFSYSRPLVPLPKSFSKFKALYKAVKDDDSFIKALLEYKPFYLYLVEEVGGKKFADYLFAFKEILKSEERFRETFYKIVFIAKEPYKRLIYNPLTGIVEVPAYPSYSLYRKIKDKNPKPLDVITISEKEFQELKKFRPRDPERIRLEYGITLDTLFKPFKL